MKGLNTTDFEAVAKQIATETSYKGKGGIDALIRKAKALDKKTNHHHYLVAAAGSLISATKWIGKMPVQIMSDFQINGFNRCTESAKRAMTDK